MSNSSYPKNENSKKSIRTVLIQIGNKKAIYSYKNVFNDKIHVLRNPENVYLPKSLHNSFVIAKRIAFCFRQRYTLLAKILLHAKRLAIMSAE